MRQGKTSAKSLVRHILKVAPRSAKVVFENDIVRIIERGGHSELLLQIRRYAELYRLQVPGARSVLYSGHFEQGLGEDIQGVSK